jgi:hypothetical protein
MPEGCNVVLNSYLRSNGKSTGAADFEITMNYAMFLRAHKYSPSKYFFVNCHPGGGFFKHYFIIMVSCVN